MSNKKHKFDGSMSHKFAVYHAIGELLDINGDGATVAQIARFMNVTKPTANKHLMNMVREGNITVRAYPFRSNSVIQRFYLIEDVYQEYINEYYRNSYRLYCQQILKVILL